ncbi:phosphoribosylaminoimidazole-succinocarboxamide synthase [Bacillus sp. FJAT-27916]|uniref:phosphoribosylaminoimidazolesuccinocarboxamide synthase n=1 Tax=Bacillus sp. FJAT-27916 TaxID=1679169 RepID=UPI000670B48F|nr:phosphoribosylaminoimidazolesuccinocarboxamide synthase [Bacillus sp. FJAT-27916]KMY45911.1 phosphoribosylaminoimidazole-succinocarboxamide synthase [Bacillus sp. FJAT-27916]
MIQGELLYEGKAKRIYATESPEIVLVQYKDSATAFNGEKFATIDGKGQLNNQITSLLFQELRKSGVESHFVEQISKNEQLVKRVSIIPLEVVVRNVSAGSFAKRVGMDEGIPLKRPIVEFYYKDDALGDPLITEDHINILELASEADVAELKEKALLINQKLLELFASVGIRLIDFKLEFGKDRHGHILLADEISPDTCRLWDEVSNEKLDKDVFRRELGSLTDAYEKILEKLEGLQNV